MLPQTRVTLKWNHCLLWSSSLTLSCFLTHSRCVLNGFVQMDDCGQLSHLLLLLLFFQRVLLRQVVLPELVLFLSVSSGVEMGMIDELLAERFHLFQRNIAIVLETRHNVLEQQTPQSSSQAFFFFFLVKYGQGSQCKWVWIRCCFPINFMGSLWLSRMWKHSFTWFPAYLNRVGPRQLLFFCYYVPLPTWQVKGLLWWVHCDWFPFAGEWKKIQPTICMNWTISWCFVCNVFVCTVFQVFWMVIYLSDNVVYYKRPWKEALFPLHRKLLIYQWYKV